MWTWADVKMSRCERRCERRCEDEQMWEKMWEKMWRWADVREDVKMSRCERRCEDEQMWRWADVREDVREDVKMSRCERRCEDEQMWEKMRRWEDVLQTPTIGRTLRSDALGKNTLSRAMKQHITDHNSTCMHMSSPFIYCHIVICFSSDGSKSIITYHPSLYAHQWLIILRYVDTNYSIQHLGIE